MSESIRMTLSYSTSPNTCSLVQASFNRENWGSNPGCCEEEGDRCDTVISVKPRERRRDEWVPGREGVVITKSGYDDRDERVRWRVSRPVIYINKRPWKCERTLVSDTTYRPHMKDSLQASPTLGILARQELKEDWLPLFSTVAYLWGKWWWYLLTSSKENNSKICTVTIVRRKSKLSQVTAFVHFVGDRQLARPSTYRAVIGKMASWSAKRPNHYKIIAISL